MMPNRDVVPIRICELATLIWQIGLTLGGLYARDFCVKSG